MGDGSGVYQYSDTTVFKQQINWLNQIYTYIDQPTLPVTPPAQHIDDSRIRFKLMNIYIHDSDEFYSSNVLCQNSYYNEFGINKESEINIFYFQNTNYPNGAGCAPFNSFYVNMLSITSPGWASAQLLAHELGHTLGLGHTFGACYENNQQIWICADDEFDDTYTPDCNTGYVHCGINETPSCPPNIFGVSNNIMGYNICRSYLSPKQLGKIHRNANSNYLYTKYIVCDYEITNSLDVSTNTTWNKSKIINGDLTISNNSILILECSLIMSDNSTITINNGSALIIESEAILTGLCDNFWSGNLTVNQGGSLIIKSNGQIRINESGFFEIKNGGYICIENGANINLSDYLSVINLRPGYISGINPSLGLSANCIADPTTITVNGNGAINTFTSDEFIQNITISSNKYYSGNNISAGYDVTNLIPFGNVTIEAPARVIIDAENEILLKNNIEIQSGSIFEMK